MKFVFLLILIIVIPSFGQNSVQIEYFDKDFPNDTPKVFAKNTFSKKGRIEANAFFSHDGKEFYFVIRKEKSMEIFRRKFVNGTWQKAKLVKAFGNGQNYEPYLTKDGKYMYFVSNRPPGSKRWNGRIWRSERMERGEWKQSKIFEIDFKTDKGLWFPSVYGKRDFYFGANSNHPKGKGKGDLYHMDLETKEITNLETLNSPNEEWDPYISDDGTYILFASDRPSGFGGTDLYVSFLKDGKWGKPINLGAKINTDKYEVAARVTPDGKYIFFDIPKDGEQDVYWVSAKIIDELRNQFFSESNSEKAPSADASDEEKLRYFKKILWRKAYAEQDTKLLDRLLHKKFQFIDNNGNVTTKADEMEYISKNKPTYDSFVYTIKRLDIFKNGTAIIAGEGRVKGKNEKGKYEYKYQSSNVLIKRNGIWKAISSHVSGFKEIKGEKEKRK